MTRRLGLAGLALGLLLPTPAVAQEVGTPVVSGLAWRSGAVAGPTFGT